MKKAASTLLWASLLYSSCLFSLSLAKHIPSFPSSAVRPEQVLQSSRDRNGLYETKYFTQILDHFNFNPQSYEPFQQRYLVNRTYWGGPRTNSPIFVYTGNEGDIEWFAQNTGFLFETAPRFKALLVFIEHRFYGKSIPFWGNKDVAYSNTSTLGFLTSTQALADYATLILDLKKNLSALDSPVVVFGGSYGGMLAAWFRLKYPHIAIGALASSSPILNFDNITSPYSFNNIITRDFRSESENCYKVIKESWDQIDATAQHQKGLEMLRKSFRICKNYINGDALQGWIRTAFVYTAMTDYPTPSNFLNPLPAYPIREMCKAIDDPTKGNDTFGKLYGAANIYYNSSGDVSCFDLDDDSDPHGLGGWTWQACTEMIMPTSGNNAESVFPASEYRYSNRFDYCRAIYGVEPRPNWITTEFDGHNIETVLKRFGSNIIFFNGLRDPWSGGGVLRNISKSIIAIVGKRRGSPCRLEILDKGRSTVASRCEESRSPHHLQLDLSVPPRLGPGPIASVLIEFVAPIEVREVQVVGHLLELSERKRALFQILLGLYLHEKLVTLCMHVQMADRSQPNPSRTYGGKILC